MQTVYIRLGLILEGLGSKEILFTEPPVISNFPSLTPRSLHFKTLLILFVLALSTLVPLTGSGQTLLLDRTKVGLRLSFSDFETNGVTYFLRSADPEQLSTQPTVYKVAPSTAQGSVTIDTESFGPVEFFSAVQDTELTMDEIAPLSFDAVPQPETISVESESLPAILPANVPFGLDLSVVDGGGSVVQMNGAVQLALFAVDGTAFSAPHQIVPDRLEVKKGIVGGEVTIVTTASLSGAYLAVQLSSSLAKNAPRKADIEFQRVALRVPFEVFRDKSPLESWTRPYITRGATEVTETFGTFPTPTIWPVTIGDPKSKMAAGIVVQSSFGVSPAVFAKRGVVIESQVVAGAYSLLAIDHGNGYITVYAGVTAGPKPFLVNDVVEAGAEIGSFSTLVFELLEVTNFPHNAPSRYKYTKKFHENIVPTNPIRTDGKFLFRTRDSAEVNKYFLGFDKSPSLNGSALVKSDPWIVSLPAKHTDGWNYWEQAAGQRPADPLPSSLVLVGSTMISFRENEINSMAFLLKGESGRVASYVHSQLSPDTIAALGTYSGIGSNPEPLRTLLESDFNRLITSGPIYDVERFAGVELSRALKTRIDQKPMGTELVILNHRLLDQAFSRALPRWHAPVATYMLLQFERVNAFGNADGALMAPQRIELDPAYDDNNSPIALDFGTNNLRELENLRTHSGDAADAEAGLAAKLKADKGGHARVPTRGWYWFRWDPSRYTRPIGRRTITARVWDASQASSERQFLVGPSISVRSLGNREFSISVTTGYEIARWSLSKQPLDSPTVAFVNSEEKDYWNPPKVTKEDSGYGWRLKMSPKKGASAAKIRVAARSQVFPTIAHEVELTVEP